MADRFGSDRFETRLERLFAEAPPYPDADAFSRRVTAQLNRGRGWRGALVGMAGVGGAVIAISQALNSNFSAAVQSAETVVRNPLAEPIEAAAERSSIAGFLEQVAGVVPTGPLGGEVLWIAAAMAAAGLALLVVRTWGEA